MDPNENTKSEPGQNHNSPGPQDSARQPEETGDTQAESPRKCKICGGPNHHGCGCEAREKFYDDFQDPSATQPESEAPAAETQTPAEPTPAKPTDEEILKVHNYYSWLRENAGMKSFALSDEPTPAEQKRPIDIMIENILQGWSEEDNAKILEGSFDMAKDIKTMANGFEGLCACMYDTNNYLKLIASDMITFRKALTKEDDEAKDGINWIIKNCPNCGDRNIKLIALTTGDCYRCPTCELKYKIVRGRIMLIKEDEVKNANENKN